MRNTAKITLLVIFTTLLLWAQEETVNMGTMLVQDSVVLATKDESRVAIVDTVSRIDIERSVATNLIDLLDGKPGVRKKVDCSACNTAHIRLLGLNGAYSQILIDGIPAYSGLGNIYGIEQIPLANVDNILVIKGASSVRHGNNAIAGVLDIIHKPISYDTKTYLKALYSHRNEQYYDAYFSTFVDKTKTGVMASFGYSNSPRIDMDKSTPMMDVAEFDRANFSMRLQQQAGEKNEVFANAQVAFEDRFGGTQSSSRQWIGSFQPEDTSINEWGDTIIQPLVYQEYARTRRVNYEIGSKTAISPIVTNENRVSFIQHKQESYYGYLNIEALQNMLFAVSDFHFDFYRNKVLAGASFTYDKFNDNRSLGSHEYTIPAIYLQDIFVINDLFDVSAGLRNDFHNVHGNILSPRFAFNYYANHHLNFKATAGKGFRTFNLFSENHAATTTSAYHLESTDNLKQESSWTFSLNGQYSQFWRVNWGITTEITAYQTMISDYIQAQYLPQFTNDGRQIVRYRNLDGTAIVRGFEGVARFNLPKGFMLDVGGNIFDFESKKETEKTFAYYSPDHTVLTKVQWSERRSGITLSFDWNYTGEQLLREVVLNKNVHKPERKSDPYSIFNAQIDKKIGRWTITAACQNIGDFYQSKVEPTFFADGYFYMTTSVWAPLKGRTFFGGVRFN